MVPRITFGASKAKCDRQKCGRWIHKHEESDPYVELAAQALQTRAPRGTDRSPEYKEHFCYKLDSRVKNVTTEWNQKQQHFITHALDYCYEFGLML